VTPPFAPCSLLVATYNWPQALDACLRSVAAQTVLPAEVIVGDDGSREETGALVQQWASQFPVPLRHLWQEDLGFRLSAIRNQSILAATQNYLIQIDGDIVLHPRFVQDHMAHSRPGWFTAGSRVLLNPAFTEAFLRTPGEAMDWRGKGNKNFFNGLRSGILRRLLASRYKTGGRNKYYVKGCNMAFWKKDLMAVNGYNEAFEGWGREDSELAIRLINAGVRKQFLKFGGIAYHLYHREASREMEAKNIAKMQAAIDQGTTWASQGINQYL
jgi:glycosyltransferase involved in cell wall biosynthesis